MNVTLARRAAQQHGAFTVTQATACGIPKSTLYDDVDRGRIQLLHPGVFAPAGAAPTWERSLSAALLAAGSDAVASHRSAGRLWRITDESHDGVEITVPRSQGPRLRGVVVHRSMDLVPSHVFRVDRIPVTKPARTLVDLGAVLGAAEVEDALDRALIRRMLTVAGVEWMRDELARQGRPGAGVIRRVLDERALGTNRPDGLLEPRMARLMRRAGLPPAEFQYPVHSSAGRFLARVDFAYVALRLAIEVDGYHVHGTRRAMEADFVRQNLLAAQGWLVVRFTWGQVVRRPEMVAGVIAAALLARAA